MSVLKSIFENEKIGAVIRNWKTPIIIWGIISIAFILCIIFQVVLNDDLPNLSNILFILYLLSMVGLIIALVYQLQSKKRKRGIIIGRVFLGSLILFILIFVAELWIEQTTPDDFTKGLKIPNDIEFAEPSEQLAELYGLLPDSLQTTPQKPYSFDLVSATELGRYDYGIWLGKIDSGTVYLKVYEVTKNTRLSPERVSERSQIKVFNPSNKLDRFYTKNSFTIYEGDWSHPYVARFEVWYQPKAGGAEKKLAEKNYKIFGWQR